MYSDAQFLENTLFFLNYYSNHYVENFLQIYGY